MKTLNSIKYLATVVLACQVAGYTQSQQPELASFGDFMEFHIGLHKACEHVPDGSNTTEPIASAFTKCINSLSATKSKDYFGGMTSICKNRDKYFACWDQMKADTLKLCGRDKESVLPALYPTTVISFCGEDNGKTTIEILTKASAETSQEAGNECPKETGINWLENCEDIRPYMYSHDLCARHKAIETCLGKITYDNLKSGKILRKIYSEGRSHLKCSRATPHSILLHERLILSNHEEKVVSSFFAMVIILTVGSLHNFL